MLRDLLREEELARKDDRYSDYHRARYAYVLRKCRALQGDRGAKVLDIGPSQLTELLLGAYDNVHVLGFDLPRFRELPAKPVLVDGAQKYLSSFVPYNLNDSQTGVPIPTKERFDLVVMAEVIEHLYTAPELVLAAIRRIMKPGGLLLCQTPNAAAIHKRLMLLAGTHPYERIRFDHTNPGHYREYTRRELIGMGRRIGLEPVLHEYKDYFGFNGGPFRRLAQRLIKVVGYAVPSFVRGQTIVYKKTSD